EPWAAQTALLLLLPLGYVVAGHFYRGSSPETPLIWCGHIAVPLVLLSALLARDLWSVVSPPTPGLLALVCAEVTAFYALNALWRQRAFNVYLATLFGVATGWFALRALGIYHVEAYTLVVAAAGLVLLLAYRLAWVESVQPKLATALFQCANVLVSLAV